MKILIISDEFFPHNGIAAVRPTKLYKYWKKQGHDVEVLTNLRPKAKVDNEELDVVRIDCRNCFERGYLKYGNSRHGFKNFLRRGFSKMNAVSRQKKWILRAKRFLKNRNGKYDVIFSTFGPKTSIEIGRIAKYYNPSSFWIADFRDPPIDKRQQVKVKNPRKFIESVYSKCDLITAVSAGCLNELQLFDQSKAIVVTNGFDRDDRKSKTKQVKNDKFIFAFTGKIYSEIAFDPFFNALNELIKDKVFDASKIQIKCAGWDIDKFIKQAETYGLEAIIENYGAVDHDSALTLQSEADMLMIETFNTTQRQGVIGGKVYEFMTANLPILAMVTGDVGNSELNKIIEKCKLGFCYEQANANFFELKDFLAKAYNDFVQEEKNEPDLEEIKQYDYEAISKNLINTVLSLKGAHR